MKNFIKAKAEYESIHASESLEKRITSLSRLRKIRTVVLKTTATAACLAAVFVTALNISPRVAYAMSVIPVIKEVVSVVTFGKYEHKENGYEAKIVTPKIEGLLDKELEDKLNSEFKENANLIIAAYENDVKELKKEFGSETVHMSIESNYEVRTDNDKILALDVYIFTASGSSNTVHSFYNIDKTTGKLLKLSDMFKKDADYVTPISEYITSEMRRMNKEDGELFWIGDEQEFFDGFKKIKPDQNFYINNDGQIVICFDKYEVAAGACGCPEFVIPDGVVADIKN